jgi:glc operon protein GlcG
MVELLNVVGDAALIRIPQCKFRRSVRTDRVPMARPGWGKLPRYLFSDLSMQTKSVLTLADVRAMAQAAEAEALANQWAVTIAIVDDGGHLLWLQRLDGAAPISAHIAPAKARTAAMGRRESKVYEDVINQGRTSFLSAPTLEGMLEGGVPVMVNGQCVGAVGVSGVKSNEDAQVARAGIAAIG